MCKAKYTILEAVPYDDQKKAMRSYQNKLLSNGALTYDPELLANLQSKKELLSS